MRVELMTDTVPEEFFAAEYQTVDIADIHASTQFPQLLLVVIPGSVGLDIALDMELLIELFHEDAFLEGPAGGILDGVDIPALGDDAILDDSRVADERVDTIAGHHRR